MKIAILGFGSQGRAALEYWQSDQNEITICDQDEQLQAPEGVAVRLGSNYLQNLHEFDLLIRTPLLHPRQIASANPEYPEVMEKVWSVTNEFMKVCPSHNIIGVTGTKGKGTTSTLISRILESAGKRVHLGGNIGIPPLDMLKSDIKPDDWVVLELANFQLIDLRHSPGIAVCLMVVPEHLDWHEDIEEYIAAKQQLFINQKDDDIAVYYADNETSLSIADASMGTLVPYMEKPGAVIENDQVEIGGNVICQTSELKLLGRHNWQNVCAAVTAVWQVTQDVNAIREAVTNFSGMEHRLEFVREINGICYYDDSFGTMPSTAQVAIEAFDQPVVIILGGSDKRASYTDLAHTVATRNVRAVVIIGQTGPAIAQALQNAGYQNLHNGGQNMKEVVSTASSLAQPGDIVLLSTACASFDMFKNYKDRGEQFKQAVQLLDATA